MGDEAPTTSRIPGRIFDGVAGSRRFNAFMMLSGRTFYIFMLASILAIFGLGVTACSLYRTTLQRNTARDHAFQMQQQAEALLESKNSDLYYDRLKRAFTEDQLAAMIGQNVAYTLSINNRQLSGRAPIVYSSTPDVVVTFSENFGHRSDRFFPEKLLHEMSSIREAELAGNIRISTGEATFETTSQTTEDGIRTDIRFTGVKPGEIITLDMDFGFAESLGLTESTVEIFYNVAK